MHILITDSGVGGLSVVAYAERFVRTRGAKEAVRLTFANAAPENDYGYNSMPSKDVKIQTFDRFLNNVTKRYAPDFIYVACNTLSVLLPDTPFFSSRVLPIKGIIETAIASLMRELQPRSTAMIFGTQTTIDSGAYSRMLKERGVDESRIVAQACPGLADTISEDREGTKTRSEIERWVAAAMEKVRDRQAPIVACLACTHYGYRKDVFADVLRAPVINPNESAVGDLFAATGASHEATVEFVTRYAIPETTIEALSYFLSDVSPRTVAAMKNFHHVADLF